MATLRLLIVDDDPKTARVLAKRLREERFVVDIAHTGAVGDEMATVNTYDVIVLDWILPDKDGITVVRDFRARGVSTPILMLSARDALEDRVTGLNTGADDYLTKPFGFEELLARLHALADSDSLNTLEVHVSHLRKKIDVAGAVPLIHTSGIRVPGQSPGIPTCLELTGRVAPWPTMGAGDGPRRPAALGRSGGSIEGSHAPVAAATVKTGLPLAA